MPAGPARLFGASRFWLLNAFRVITCLPVLEVRAPNPDDRGMTPSQLTRRYLVVVVKTNRAGRRGVHRRSVIEIKFAAFNCCHKVVYRHFFEVMRLALVRWWLPSSDWKHWRLFASLHIHIEVCSLLSPRVSCSAAAPFQFFHVSHALFAGVLSL